MADFEGETDGKNVQYFNINVSNLARLLRVNQHLTKILDYPRLQGKGEKSVKTDLFHLANPSRKTKF